MALKITFECPHCHKMIRGLLAIWEYSDAKKEDNPILLKPCSCESGGLYACYIECPECGEDIDVFE